MNVLQTLILIYSVWVAAEELPAGCDVAADTEAGKVCGRKRNATNGDQYASFRGIRYAKAPLGELRFAEPQNPDPYDGVFDATETGPICPQVDVIYGPLMQPRTMDEDCLRLNVHVPLDSLPDPRVNGSKVFLPVLVFVHGGSFSFGSGDPDIYGPEYLMSGKGIIFVTMNFRVNVLGFFTLFSKEIPGNAGLRDALFALKWVQRNIKNFGGDPEKVTLGGQSSGAVMAHILSISPAVKDQNLFKRVMSFSGTAISGMYSPSHAYSTAMNTLFLQTVGINILKSPEDIHKDLVELPIHKLLEGNKRLLDISGVITFVPVIEKPQAGFTTILPRDPETLVMEGQGKEYTLWLGFTNNETQSFMQRFEEVHLERTLRRLPALTLPLNIAWAANPLAAPVITGMQLHEYFNNSLITLEKFMIAATDGLFKYPVMRLAEKRLSVVAEPTYVSQFGYHGIHPVTKVSQIRDWVGASHVEDISYCFRVNSFYGPDVINELTMDNDDSRMRSWMTDLVAQFVKTGSPVPKDRELKWPPTGSDLWFQRIDMPQRLDFRPLGPYMEHVMKYFDKMYKIARGL